MVARKARRRRDDRGEREDEHRKDEGRRRLPPLQLCVEQEGRDHGQGHAVRLRILRQEHQPHGRQEDGGDGEAQRRPPAPP